MVFLPTDILPRSLLGAVARTPLDFVRRRARRATGSRRGARYVEGLGSNAHYNDPLLASGVTADVVRYRRGAVEFVEVLSQALEAADRSWGDVRTCLDGACGYGRIIRELLWEMPPEGISVCDAREEGVQFTASEFAVCRVPTLETMGLQFENSYHLVYLLDAYTRLDRRAIEASLAAAGRVLRPEGVLVFTTRGQMGEHADPKRVAAFERDGFAHRRLAFGDGEAGTTWIAPAEVERLVAAVAPVLARVAHLQRGFGGDRDVFVYRKR